MVIPLACIGGMQEFLKSLVIVKFHSKIQYLDTNHDNCIQQKNFSTNGPHCCLSLITNEIEHF